MKLTKLLKSWLIENAGVDKDSDDACFISAAAEALAKTDGEDGALPVDKYRELCQTEEVTAAKELSSKLDRILDFVQGGGKPREEEGLKLPTGFQKEMASSSGEGAQATVRVKGAHEQYEDTRKQAYWPESVKGGGAHHFAGKPVFEGGDEGQRYLHHASELDKAISGAWCRYLLHLDTRGKSIQVPMTDHDRQLIDFAIHERAWAGILKGNNLHAVGSDDEGVIGVKNRKLSPSEQKALIDDSTSGGLEIAPIAFDDAIILVPLLHGELFPRVNVVNVTRGRRMEGGSIVNPTMSWGGGDDTSTSLFSTSSMVSAFDTTIHSCDGAIEIGLDFMTDSPVNVGTLIPQRYGEQLMKELDRVIAVGNGSTEPEGLMNASGTVGVNDSSAAPTVGGYLASLFSVPKQYRNGFEANRIAFFANETTYRRARAIAVGGSDARLVFGMEVADYQLLGHPYAIQSDMTNAQRGFANFARYRMYRRMGFTIRSTTEGKELTRKNLMLIVAKSRYGGQLEDGSAAAITSDAQA